MSEPINQVHFDEATEAQQFKDMLDESLMSLRNGAIVKGTIQRVTNTEVIVDLGYKSDGIITKSEFTDDTSAILTEIAKPGDIVEVFVIRVNDGEGNVLVSKKKVDNQLNFRALEQAFEEKTVLPGKITDVVKGGLVANILGCRAFVPASQISARYESDLESFKGKEFNFNIIEYGHSKGQRRIVAGRRELAAKEAAEARREVFGKIEVGQTIEGTVSRLVDFGAFVDLGGIDGLIHVSELSWKRVRKPSDVLASGDKVKATVVGVDPEKGKISLTLKDMASNPWNGITERFPVDSIVDGTVARLAPFGAFVTLEDGIDGLVHISQIADHRIAKPDEVLTPGQVIQVKILDIDLETQKISLSKREADYILNPPPPEPEEEEIVEEEVIEEEVAVEEEVIEEAEVEATAEEAEEEPEESDE